MKKIEIIPIVLFFLLYFISACHKECVKRNLPANYFPNTVGDTWEYEVTDSAQAIGGSNDTVKHYLVKVVITGTKKLIDGKEATIWQYQYPFGNDTNYVRISADSIKVFDRIYSQTIEDLNYPRKVFLIPFSVNRRWNGKLLYVDSFRVIKQEDLLIGNQKFCKTFNIYHHYIGPNTEYKDYYWFKPSIGMVNILTSHYNLGPIIYRSWTLKTYSLH